MHCNEGTRSGRCDAWPGLLTRLTLHFSQLPRPGGGLREQRARLPLLTECVFPSCRETAAVGSGQVQMARVPESVTSLPLHTGSCVRMEVGLSLPGPASAREEALTCRDAGLSSIRLTCQ